MAATGFGTVTMDLGKALLDKGLDVRFVSQNDLVTAEGKITLPEPFASRTIDTASLITDTRMEMPAVMDVASFIPNVVSGKADDQYVTTGEAWGEWRPDAVVILGDFAAVRMFLTPYKDAFAAVPTYHYVPIEGVDLPPLWKSLWDIAKPVAMSQFGADEIEKVVKYRPPVAYHGVDVSVFHPATPQTPILIPQKDKDGESQGTWIKVDSKQKAKAFFGFDPRSRWVLRTDSHWPRKNQNALIRSMVPVLQSHPDTMLVLHVGLQGPGGYLPDTTSKYPQIDHQIRFTGLGKVPREILALLYNAADVYASTSAEGFGLTLAEAIACGVPAVGLQYSAVPEVIGPAGAVVPIDTITDNEYDHFWARPDEAKFGDAVDWMLSHPKRARELGAKGPKHVRDNFTWDRAADVFMSVLGVNA